MGGASGCAMRLLPVGADHGGCLAVEHRPPTAREHPMRGTIHHLDLTVHDPWASREFYDAVLGFLGYRRSKEDAHGFDWELRDDSGRFVASIGVMRASGSGLSRRHDR